MFPRRIRSVRRSAAVGALLLAGTGALLPSPATAVDSGALAYECGSTTLGSFAANASHSFDPGFDYGGWLPVWTHLGLPEALAERLEDDGVRWVDWRATTHHLVNGAKVTASYEDDSWVFHGADGTGLSTSLFGYLSTSAAAEVTQADEVAELAVSDLRSADGTEVADLVLKLTLHTDADGDADGRHRISCELTDGQELGVGTVIVDKAYTETIARIGYAKRTKKLVSKALTWSSVSDATVAGKVELVLTRNGKSFASRTVRLNDAERASFAVPAPRKGRYELVVAYPGSTNFMPSKDTATRRW